jgi:glycosyltransferase involved in cell wall biosynthesis
VHLPDIGRVLPVYVADRYPGVDAKAFPELSEEELDGYLDANVRAVEEVAAGGVDAALANHLIMGPAILARAGLQYAAKVHGSDLLYTVEPHPERFAPYAREGTDGARGILVGSRNIAERVWDVVPDPGLPDRTRLGPPGVDVDEFAPATPEDATAGLRELAERLRWLDVSEMGRNPEEAAAALQRYADCDGPRILFVGKLIAAKGVDWLLEAWPRVLAEHPNGRLLIAAFGEQEAELRDLAAERGPDTIDFVGRLEHSEVATVMRAADALVMPSREAEAFGMVAAEAAACGTLPVCADHSGLGEVAAALASDLPQAAAPLVSFRLEEGPPQAIADRLLGWQDLGDPDRAAAREALAASVRRRWSWERVAEGVLTASAGRLDELDPIPPD